MSPHITPVDYRLPDHRGAIVQLLESYAGTPHAGGAGMADEARSGVVAMLETTTSALVLLALEQKEPVGMAVCCESFSTFAARPIINIHDLVIAPSHQGKGIGRKLIEAVEREARQRGCCALTLEVLGDNLPALKLYRRCGFQGGQSIDPPDTPMFWKKKLD